MTQQPVAEQIFAGNSEMARLMRALDWSQTPLSAVETWSQSLRTSVSICLKSRFPILIWWGAKLVMLYNDAYCSILGTKHPQALGQAGQECWSEIWDVIGPMLEGVLASGQATWSDDQLLLINRNGYIEECYFTFSYSPIPDETGQVGGIFTAVTETTARVIGERRLQTLSQLAANTVEAKTVADACRLAMQTLNDNPDDVPLALLYLVEDNGKAHLAGTAGIPGSIAALQQIDLSQSDVWNLAQFKISGQAQLIHDLPSRFATLPEVAWSGALDSALVLPIAQSGQKQQLAALLVLGISPRREFDTEYHRFFDLVASNVATAIANADAYAAERKRAETLAELDRAKTAFFSNVSHEFRTPLTLMLSPLAELINNLDERLQSDEREQLQLVQRNGLRLQKLVNTLLDFSRIEAGRVQAMYEPTDLALFTAELASVFRSMIEHAGMTFTIDCPELPEFVYVDRSMWEKIVLNLISNAFKFTFAGNITVRLRAVNDAVELSVKDTGVGIPEAELPRLFERFHRVSGTRSRTYEGSGIGLALVQELVKLHGGCVSVSSALEQGTTFTVTIPLGIAHLPPERIQTQPSLQSTALGVAPFVEEALRWIPEEKRDGEAGGAEVAGGDKSQWSTGYSSPASPAPILSSARILLAEDNADMRDYVKRLLSQRYEVETVVDGMAALAAIRRQKPDLVITDIMMPRLDGFGLLHQLRTQPTTQDLPIILLSARAGEESRVEGLEAGADDYLIKPFSARELMARVEATLKLAQLRRAAQQREQALRLDAEAAEIRLQGVLASIGDDFVVVDCNWQIVYVNVHAAATMGMEPEDAIGKNLWELFPDVVGTEFYDRLQQVMRERTPTRFEYYYPIWDRWFENRVYPTPDGIANICTDITNRKRAEAAQQISEERFRLATRAVNGMIFDWNLQTGEIYRSEQLFELVGIHSEDAPPTKTWWYERVHPDNRTRLQQIPGSFGEDCDLYDCEYRVRHEDGRWIDVWERGCLIRDSNGQVIRIVGSTSNISIRKQSEALLQQSEAQFRQLANAMPQIVWVCNADGKLEFVNERWTKYTGLTLEQTGDPVMMNQIIPPEDNQQLYADFAQAQLTQSPYRSQFRLNRSDGSYLYFLVRAVPIKDEQGHIHKWYGTSTDITELKQLAAERENLLAQEQSARKAAEQANSIKDEFLAVLSHELRTPMNPILGWSKLLQDGRLNSEKAKQAIATIERNAKLQVQLIDDLLDISRILRGKLSLTIAPVDLGLVITAALETVRLAAEAKSLSIQTIISPAAGCVSGDAGRLQQVVWNLLSNAVKFTPTGGQITVELSQVGINAQIQVSDTGKGINPQFLPYIFEYFRQEDGATTRKFGGLGLGLAIARQIVEMHGGLVFAESPGEGQGATFTVQIPIAPQGVELPVLDSGAQSALDLSDVHILVVDDDADSCEFVAFVLEQAGASVTMVSSGIAALKTIRQSIPHLIVSDIGMPEMDGYQLMRQLRSLKSAKCVPAIALTAYAGEYDQQQAIASGFQQHLAKPVDSEKLMQAIARLLKRGEKSA